MSGGPSSEQKTIGVSKHNSALANYASAQPSKTKVIKLKQQQVSQESVAYVSQRSPQNNIISGVNVIKVSQPGFVYKHFNPKARHSLPINLNSGGVTGSAAGPHDRK